MSERREVAERILGRVERLSPVEGLCRCPGEALHQNRDGKRDCRIKIDGAPTIYCFHQSCAVPVAEANRRLRRECERGGGVLPVADQVEKRIAGPEAKVVNRVKALALEKRARILEKHEWPLMEIMEGSPVGVAELSGEDQFRAWLSIWDPVHSGARDRQ